MQHLTNLPSSPMSAPTLPRANSSSHSTSGKVMTPAQVHTASKWQSRDPTLVRLQKAGSSRQAEQSSSFGNTATNGALEATPQVLPVGSPLAAVQSERVSGKLWLPGREELATNCF